MQILTVFLLNHVSDGKCEWALDILKLLQTGCNSEEQCSVEVSSYHELELELYIVTYQ